MKILPTFSLLGFMLNTLWGVPDKMHEFTSSDGLKINASIVSCEDEKVTIIREDGQKFTVDKSRFSTEDQKYIEDWKRKKDSELSPVTSNSRFTVKVDLKSKPKLNSNANSNKKSETISPQIILKNNEPQENYGPIEGLLLVIGESVRSPDKIKVLSKQKIEFSKVDKQSKVNWSGKTFRNEYNSKSFAKFGYKCIGYILILKNKDGPLFYSKASSSSWLNYIDQLDQLTEGKIYNRKFEKIGQ